MVMIYGSTAGIVLQHHGLGKLATLKFVFTSAQYSFIVSGYLKITCNGHLYPVHTEGSTRVDFVFERVNPC